METGRKYATIVLAAGESTRMGIPKALLEYEVGCTFLRRLISLFQTAGCEVLTVVGKDAQAIRNAHPEAALIHNPRWKDGQLSSARAGIRSAVEAGAHLVLVHPVDAPAVKGETVEALLSEFAPPGEPATTAERAAVPVYEGKSGHPLVLSRSAAEKVLQMDVPHLEAALEALPVRRIDVADPGVVLSVNTPQEYRRAFGREPRTASG